MGEHTQIKAFILQWNFLEFIFSLNIILKPMTTNHCILTLILCSSWLNVILYVAEIQQLPIVIDQKIMSGWAVTTGSGSAQG